MKLEQKLLMASILLFFGPRKMCVFAKKSIRRRLNLHPCCSIYSCWWVFLILGTSRRHRHGCVLNSYVVISRFLKNYTSPPDAKPNFARHTVCVCVCFQRYNKKTRCQATRLIARFFFVKTHNCSACATTFDVFGPGKWTRLLFYFTRLLKQQSN